MGTSLLCLCLFSAFYERADIVLELTTHRIACLEIFCASLIARSDFEALRRNITVDALQDNEPTLDEQESVWPLWRS